VEGDEPRFIQAHPVTWADGPLTFDPESRSFQGTVSLVLQDSVSPGVSQPVDPPMAIVLSSDADQLDRTRIDLARTGFPPETVRMTVRHPTDSVRLDIRTPADIGGVVLRVPIRPTVVIETPPHRVPGWGVGEYLVTVEVHGAEPGREVRLQPSVPGIIDSAGLNMGQARTTQLSIRSRGLGPAPLRVSAAGLASDEVVFTYVFPIWFFALGILGAALGAAIGASQTDDRRGRDFLNRFGIGLAGMLAYFVLGVQIFAIDSGPVPISEIAVLTVALIAALVTPNLFGLLGGRRNEPTAAAG
jgi:hypothetical protein